LIELHQESVVTVGRVNDFHFSLWYMSGQKTLFTYGEQQIMLYADDKCTSCNLRYCFFNASASSAYIVAVHYLGQYPVRKCVEAVCEFLSLVPLIRRCPVVVELVGGFFRLRLREYFVLTV